MTRRCPRVHALDDSESSKLARELHATREARISKNGYGIEGRREEKHPVETYPSDAEGRASFSSATERKSEEERGAEGVLSPGDDGNGGGVKRGSSRVVDGGGGLTA